jgi:hypothetical protein
MASRDAKGFNATRSSKGEAGESNEQRDKAKE